MSKTTKIAISLPETTLIDIEKERRDSGESRSQFFRRAVEMLLKYQREQKMREKYTRAYRSMPETGEDIKAARYSANSILSKDPW